MTEQELLVELSWAASASPSVNWTKADARELEFLALGYPKENEAAWLRNEGVSAGTDERFFVKAASVAFLADMRFEFVGDGERAFIVAARDADGEVIDLVAWAVGDPTRFAVREGRARGLGEELLDVPSLATSDPLPIFRTPLEWLLQRGGGYVILDPRTAWLCLQDCPRVAAADLRHGEELETLLQPPRPTVLVPRIGAVA